jgi:hypothetical protein
MFFVTPFFEANFSSKDPLIPRKGKVKFRPPLFSQTLVLLFVGESRDDTRYEQLRQDIKGFYIPGLVVSLAPFVAKLVYQKLLHAARFRDVVVCVFDNTSVPNDIFAR